MPGANKSGSRSMAKPRSVGAASADPKPAGAILDDDGNRNMKRRRDNFDLWKAVRKAKPKSNVLTEAWFSNMKGD